MTALPSLKNLASADALKTAWAMLQKLPAGGFLMGQLIGRLAPYTGTIRPEIVTLEPGRATVRMRDRRSVRNHLNSLHAIALMNLGEVSTGAAMLVSAPSGTRAIIKRLAMDYEKKARGTITAHCELELPSSSERREYEVQAELRNEAGELVARAHATWLVGPA